jgi:hypothetical protein
MQANRGLGSVKVYWLLVAAGAAIVWGCDAFASREPQGDVLIYEADGQGTGAGLDKVCAAVHGRLNSEEKRFARVGRLDGRRIEVALYARNDQDTQRAERLLGLSGSLEFRILANTRDNKELIERASADPSRAVVANRSKEVLAWWVPIVRGEEASLRTYREIALRENAKEKRTEVLVLNDDYNISGAYATEVSVGVDNRGLPCTALSEKRSIG